MSAESNKQEVAVLGAGTWGVVLAQGLQANGASVRVWDYYRAVIENLEKDRAHPKLPGFQLSEEIVLTSDLATALGGASVAVIVVPSTAVRSLCESVAQTGLEKSIETWVLCSKGIETKTLLPLHAVVASVLGRDVEARLGVLSGPSHAEEVARGLPTTIVACASHPEVAERISKLFFQPRLRVYTHDDLLGVELGGALKNVIAIAAGVADGMGFGDNTRAALVTRGLAEIVRLGVAMGARAETFMGLSGVGDLVVTATSVHSRNHRFGELLAQGKTTEEALEGVGMVVEGYATAKSAHDLGLKYKVDMPITEAVHRVLYDGVPARKAIETLLSREARSESE